MQKFRQFSLVTLIILSLGYIQADNAPIDKDSIVMSYTANEVVVQAFKSNENLEKLPISSTLLSEQTIKDRNITNIKEISSFVPNLFIHDYGSKLSTPVFIRGIGSKQNAPSVGLYVDGIPYFDRSSLDFNMQDIDRIEVLRGPQGTIYGRNTMGGIINVYTKSPFKYKETNVGLSAANYDTYEVKASHLGSINNTFGYSVSGNYMHTGGYFRNVTMDKKADPMDAASGRVRLSWKPSQQLQLHLTSAYEYSDQDGYPYAIYNDQTGAISPINYNAPSYYRRNMSTTGLHAQYTTDKIKLSSQSAFQFFDGKQGLDQDFLPQDMYYVVFDQKQRMYSQEFNLKSVGESNYQWLFGAFGFYQDYSTNNNIHYFPIANQPANIHRNDYQDVTTPTKGFALFHQSVFNNILVDGLSATLGIRYDWEQIKAHTVTWSQPEGQPIKDGLNKRDNDTYSQFSPKVSLQYTFTNDELVYMSVSKGFKAGGFNNTVRIEEMRKYKPEHSWSYEIGTKASCLNKLIYTDLSFFFIKWEDQQISQYQPDLPGYIINNAGSSQSKGMELTVHVNPLEALSFQVGYGYTHATFKDYNDNKEDYSGHNLPLVPRHTLSLAANYGIKLKNQSIVDKIVLNAQYKAAGRMYWREDNIASQPFYGTLNGQISFYKKNISLDLWAKNITEKHYIAYYFKSMGGSYVQEGKPFTCGVNVNFKF